MIERICIKTYTMDDYIPIHRPSKYGNIYTSKNSKIAEVVNNKNEAIEKFRKYLLKNQYLVDDLINDLKINNYTKIGCFCKEGSKCHGDVYLEFINERRYKSIF